VVEPAPGEGNPTGSDPDFGSRNGAHAAPVVASRCRATDRDGFGPAPAPGLFDPRPRSNRARGDGKRSNPPPQATRASLRAPKPGGPGTITRADVGRASVWAAKGLPASGCSGGSGGTRERPRGRGEGPLGRGGSEQRACRRRCSQTGARSCGLRIGRGAQLGTGDTRKLLEGSAVAG